MTDAAPWSHRLEVVARGSMFAFGLVVALVGAVAPVLTDRLALTLADVGALFVAMNLAMLVASLVLGLIVDRLGLRLPLVGGALLVSIGLVLVARAPALFVLLTGVAILGFGGGWLNGAANTLVADLHVDALRKAAALNRLGVFFGFGALALPFSIGALTAALGLGGVLLAAAAACGLLALGAAVVSYPSPKQPHGWPLTRMRALIRQPAVLVLAVLLFLQSGNEFLLGGYIASRLTTDMGTAVPTASYWLAAFWAAIMLTRVALSSGRRRLSPETVVVAGALAATAASIGIGATSSSTVTGLCAVLTGVALAGIFPSVLALAGARFREESGTVFGVLFAVALAGGMTVPWSAGLLAHATGIRWVFVLAAVGFVCVAIAGRAAGRLLHSSTRSTPASEAAALEATAVPRVRREA